MRRYLIVFSVLVVCVAASVVGVGAPLPRAAAADPVIAAAGDIACAPPGTRTSRQCHQAATANLLAGATAVLPVGDEQYNCGQLSAFNQVYDPSWGRFKSISHPVVGDNEYAGNGCSTPGASGYYTYFGDRASPRQPGCTSTCQGYYSYNVGSWHVVALNSECTQPGVGGCSSSSGSRTLAARPPPTGSASSSSAPAARARASWPPPRRPGRRSATAEPSVCSS
jgi:hypothetical protein